MECYNILALFPYGAKSHNAMFQRIVEGLAEKGHKIDVYSHHPRKNQTTNIKDIDLSKELSIEGVKIPPSSLTTMECIWYMLDLEGTELCEVAFKNKLFQELKNTKKRYDVLLVELFGHDCFFAFGYHLNIPIVALTSSNNLPWGGTRLGNPDNPSYIPTYFSDFTPDMNFYQRLINAINLFRIKLRHASSIELQTTLVKEFFASDMPDLNKIVSNTSLLLVNSHFSVDQAIPKIPNFIEIGGVHIKQPKSLPEEILAAINNKKFIYFSLGSLLEPSKFDEEVLEKLFNVFEELKYTVLWSGEKKSIPKTLTIPNNIKFLSWLPQLDVLCNPNALLFITHSGLMGTQESIYCGVPVLSNPFFADQFGNSKNMENKGMGKQISLVEDSKESLIGVIKELINNPKYKNNAKLYSEKFKNRPRSPLEEAIYWIEYVAQYNGAPELKSQARNLSWYQYYLIDVLLVISLSISIAIFFIIFALKRLLRLIFCNSNNKVKRQ